MSNINSLTKTEREQIYREVLHEHNIAEARWYCEHILRNLATNATESDILRDLRRINYDDVATRFEEDKQRAEQVGGINDDTWCNITDLYMFNVLDLDENKYDV